VTAEERYATILDQLAGRPDVTGPAGDAGSRRGFGSTELKVGGRIFAMLVRGRLVVKLPRRRVDALVASGAGERFDPRRDGRLMKEWLTVDPAAEERWLPLATEALEFVASRG
jgi:TfoX/Sxy family transcriptional regulator of competence genes